MRSGDSGGFVVRVGMWGLVLLLVYVGVCLVMFLSQGSYIYFPEKGILATPGTFGMAFEDVRLHTQDGESLGAWWVPAENARGALVLCHGNAGNISNRLDKIDFFHGLGLSVLAFDYRGYGTSTGEPSEAGTYLDVESAVQFVHAARGFPFDRILLYGESLGGAVAIEAATRREPGGLIVESSFSSARAMAKHYYPWLPTRLLLRIRYDSLSKVPGIRCPKLFMHSHDDDIVPYRIGRALFEAAAEPRAFVHLRGGHNDGGMLVTPGARESVGLFVDEVLAGH
jgi:hypothetical protein